MENIFQSAEWESFKLATGYQKSYRVHDILVLQKNLPLGYTMLYSPMVGSEAAGIMNNESRIREFISEVQAIADRNKSIFYRLEIDAPEVDHDSKFEIRNSAFGFAKSFEEMQPEHSLVLDLTQSEEEILAQMKQKGRYNIKIAEREGILIEKSDKTDSFYKMYEETGKRHKITYRGKSYFDALIEKLGEKGYASVYEASAQINGKKTPLAAAIIVSSGERSIYMFGSSSDEYKNMMAPYLLHWTIIRRMKEAGFKKYDFFGIAPDDNPKHPWAGVTRFKKQFGGAETAILGSFDLPFKPFMYQLFKIAEKIRR